MATKVSINKALEARLRAAKDVDLIGEIVRLLDDAQRAVDSKSPGLGYKELAALFISHLGSDIVFPMKPSTGYIVKIVNKAAELGISKDNVRQICEGLRASWRPPYSFWWVISKADQHFQQAQRGEKGDEGRVLHTGRESAYMDEDD